MSVSSEGQPRGLVEPRAAKLRRYHAAQRRTGDIAIMATARRVFLSALLAALSTGVVLMTSNTANAQSASQDKIIVSGASGQLGTLVVKGLLQKGVPAKNLILVSRAPKTLDEYAKQGAQVRFGDVEKPDSLPAAYAGGTRLLLISIGFGGSVPRPEAHRHGIEAAKAAGVKQIVYTSWVALTKGDATGIGADHAATEEILKKSGVPYTFLRNSIYQDILLGAAGKIVADGKATAVPNEIKLGYVTREDCAAAAVAVLTTPGHDNKAYDITGPDLLGQAEIAAAASAVTGKSIPVVQPDPGAPSPRAFGGPAASVVSGDVQKLTGRAPTSFRTFLETNKAKLAGNT
jgi:NAD(P)H dehydrogenase (quinone)